MGKDPAILFYTSDFLTGTFTMTNEQVGMYIKLLCLQHQKGKLSERDMLFVCGTPNNEVYEKFEKDAEGFFFNKILKEKADERKAYSESRRKNIQKRYIKPTHESTYEPTCVVHMENEIENENENVIEKENKEGGAGGRFNVTYPYDSINFKSTWQGWKTHLIEIGKPYQTFSSEQAGLQFLADYTEKEAIEIIRTAIRSGWKNLHEPDQKSKNHGNTATITGPKKEFGSL